MLNGIVVMYVLGMLLMFSHCRVTKLPTSKKAAVFVVVMWWAYAAIFGVCAIVSAIRGKDRS